MIKHMQKCFTSEYQSERLINIGLPVDTADCYYSRLKHYQYEVPRYCYQTYSEHAAFHPGVYDYCPCWSVGRLMEIIDTCDTQDVDGDEEYPTTKKVKRKVSMDYIEFLVQTIEKAVEADKLDFSRLNND